GVNGVGFSEPRVVPGELVAVGVAVTALQGTVEEPGLSREVVVLAQRPAAVVEQIAAPEPTPRGLLKQVVAGGRVRRGAEHGSPLCGQRGDAAGYPHCNRPPKTVPARTCRVAQY